MSYLAGLLGGNRPLMDYAQSMSNQPQMGQFATNSQLPGGYEALMHQQFGQMPHLANPRAPEVTLQGDYLDVGERMRIPNNLMPNVPRFGQINQQTQWGGYWSPEMTGMAGPHGIAPGYGFYNSNSPVNYTGLMAQSNPFWGNPVAGPAFPTPSPVTLSPYYGNDHFNDYFSTIRGNVQQTPTDSSGQDAGQGGSAGGSSEIDPLTGCPADDQGCIDRFWMNYG